MGWMLHGLEARALAAMGALLSLAGCASTETQQGPAAPPGTVLADLQMVRVPGGIFRMGSSSGPENLRPGHVTVVNPFYLSRYEITVGQFAQFVKETGYQTDAELNHGEGQGCRVAGGNGPSATFQAGSSWRNPGFEQTDRHPVVCVSYNDSHAFLAWLNGRSTHHYRLPSETEWEFTARADSTSASAAEACAHAAAGGGTPSTGCGAESQPVGSSTPNRFGVYDLLGMGTELAQDCWHPDFKHAPHDGNAWMAECAEGNQITVVGIWNSGTSGVLENRTSLGRMSADNHLGFRIAEDSDSARAANSAHY